MKRSRLRPWWQVTSSPWASLALGLLGAASATLHWFAGSSYLLPWLWSVFAVTYLASAAAAFRWGHHSPTVVHRSKFFPFWPPDEH